MASGTGLSYINSPTQSGSSMLGHSVLPHGAGGATYQYESKGGYPEFSTNHLSQHRKTTRRKPKKGKTQNGGRKKHSKSRKHKQRRRKPVRP